MADILSENATELDPKSQWHSQIDLAAISAFKALTDSAKEQGGVIFRNKDGHYAYSLPVPGDRHNFSLRARFNSEEMQLAGIYHTHPGGGDANMFSANDIESARKLNLLSFIKAVESGEIRRFDPATSRVRRSGGRMRLGDQRAVSSLGEPVQGLGGGLLGAYSNE